MMSFSMIALGRARLVGLHVEGWGKAELYVGMGSRDNFHTTLDRDPDKHLNKKQKA